jgi:hypothetical protein
LHIFCEGQTEEIIAREVIEPHLGADVRVSRSIFTTKRPAGGPAFKGGLSRWPKLERELQRLLQDSSTTVLTTMFDYYGSHPTRLEWPTARTDPLMTVSGMSSQRWSRRSTTSASFRTLYCTRSRHGYSLTAVGLDRYWETAVPQLN